VTYVCIRDDDVNAFTPPYMLQETYRPLLDAGLPLNIAVIPAVETDVPIDAVESNYFRQEGVRQNPIVPVDARGEPGRHPISQNSEMIRFVADHPGIEIAQHGYDHALVGGEPEFCTTDGPDLLQRLDKGRQQLVDSFGAPPAFFVPPWDRVSQQAMGLVRERFDGISLKNGHTGCFSRPTRLRLRIKPLGPFLWLREFLVLEHPGYVVTRFHAPEYMEEKTAGLVREEAVVVLVVHHWEFFYDWEGPDEPFLNTWHRVLQGLIDNPDVRIVSFSELHGLLKGR
jgi:hypothetical protein